MAWTLYAVPSAKKAELETVLHDDAVSRQSHKVRDAPTLGGPAAELFVLIEGSTEAVARASELLGPVGTKVPPADAERIYARLKEEEDAASAGMGLFFTE